MLLTVAFAIHRYTWFLGSSSDLLKPIYLILAESCDTKGQLALGESVTGIKESHKICDCPYVSMLS